MNEKIRILCIAPYESMRGLIQTVSRELPEVEASVYVGDLNAGLEIALRDFHNNYDAVISRGCTAEVIRRQIDLPVIEIPVTVMDIVRAMRLAESISKPFAIIGSPNILVKAKTIPALLGVPLMTFPASDDVEARHQLQQIGDKKYILLCDMISYTTAQEMGMNAILITSDADSIRTAFHEATRVCENYSRLREENLFLRKLLWNQIHNTVVFTGDGTLYFSTVQDVGSPIVQYLQKESQNAHDEVQNHFLKQINNVSYNIRKHYESFYGKEYTIFYFSESRVASQDVRRGIRFLSRREAEEEYQQSFYSAANLMRDMQQQIQQVNTSSQPLMVCGEAGTCKEEVVCYIYSNSEWKKHPLVIVDCFMLGEKSWNFLMDHHNSPLAKSDSTIFIQDIDTLSAPRRHQLMVALLTMEVCKRNRVILSCVCGANQRISEEGLNFTEKLECLTLLLPPLRMRASRMSSMVTFYLNYLNVKLEGQTLGTNEQAIKALQAYDWPHNYSQFKRVMHGLTLSCPDRYITAEDVEAVLLRERNMTSPGTTGEGREVPLDLRMTLNELNKEIIRRVLEEEGGNQTSTAQRLGIGRTTLWRLLNNG